MKKNKFNVLLSVCALALASLACQAVTNGRGNPIPAATATPELHSTSLPKEPTTVSPAPTPPPEPEVVPVISNEAGMACLGTKNMGVACIDDASWHVFTEENSPLESNYITSTTTCPDGNMVFAHYNGFSLFDGQNWSSIGNGDFSSLYALACDRENGLWVAHYQGISHYSAGQWTKFGSDQLANGDSVSDLVYDVAISPTGKIWVVTSNSVASFDGQEWTIYQQGRGFDEKLYFSAIAFDPTGRPVVSYGNGFAIFDDDQWRLTNSPGYITTGKAMAIDPRGQIWLGTQIEGVHAFEKGTWTQQTFATSDLSSNSINALAADARGRVWAATEYGLSVLVDGQWQVFRMDNSALPANDLSGVAVVAAGPQLPAPQEKAPGTLTGQVKNKDGAPVPNSAVEICAEVIGTQFFGATPCSDQPFFLTGKSDAEGRFHFENVPAGYYTLVMQIGDGWAQLTGDFGFISEQVLIQPGQSTDIGDITMKE
jgi:hypothetical protein